MDEIDALRRMRTALAETEDPNVLAGRIDYRAERPEPVRRERRRPGFRLRLVSAAAVGAVAAGTAGVVVLQSGDGGSGPGSSSTTSLEGNVLLAAAASAEKAPSGKYWHTKSVMGDVYGVGKSAANHYKVDSRQGNESWIDRNGLRRMVHNDMADVPLTAQDKQKWQAAGSPKWVSVPDPEGSGGKVKLDMSGGANTPWPSSVERFYGMTAQQIAALPTDARALENKLLDLKDQWHAVSSDTRKEPIRALKGEERIRALSDVLGTLLSTAPAPPAVRAAAFRVLAAQPGVKPEGRVRDPLGRTGTGVSLPLKTTVPLGLYTAPKQLGTYRRQFVVDPATGRLLAIQDVVAKPPQGSKTLPPGDDGKPRSLRAKDMPDRFHRSGELASYQAFEVSEWTNSEPPR